MLDDPGYNLTIAGLDFFQTFSVSKLFANAVFNFANVTACPFTPGMVVVKGVDVANVTTKTGQVLQALSLAACTNVNADPDQYYAVGMVTTAAPNVAIDRKVLSTFSHQLPVAAFGLCVAVSPCKRDLLYGFKGLSLKFPVFIPPLPPAVGEGSINAISVSQSGTGARINNRWFSIPLWKWTDATDNTTLGPDITGNLLVDVTMSLSWDFSVVTVGLKGQFKMLIKYDSPVRFALQSAVAPAIGLFGSAFDLKMLGVPTANFLVYTQYYNKTNWDVYAGVQAAMNFSSLVSMLPGDAGDLLESLVDVLLPATRVTLNIHANQDGGGVRLFFQSDTVLAQAFASILRAIGVDIPTFKSGLGVRLSVAKTGKVMGYVNINGRDWGTSLCTSNSQCGDGSVCTLGICSIQYGCARSFQRKPYSLADVGVCPSGTLGAGLLCYSRCPADKPFTPTVIDPYCYENCNCATTAGPASLCSGPCKVFGATVSPCGCGIRKRGILLKTNPTGVGKRCPASKPNQLLAFCYESCPPGYRWDTSGCVLNSCPPQFPVSCGGSGIASWCVKPGSKLGCAQLSAAFKDCPAP